MKILNLYLAALALVLSVSARAQIKPVAQNTSSTYQAKAPASKSLSAQTDSLKMAMNDVKNSFSSLFGGKRDTIAIIIAPIEYDDANLGILKENLKKLKGVKSVAMQYKSGKALFTVSFKGKAADLWDALPAEAKQSFKLTEADDHSVIIEHKTDKLSQQ